MVLPNQLTVLRIILTPVFLFLFLSGDSLMIQISLAVYLIAAITDWYDGWLARKFNYITDWGKFLDPLADKILTSAAFFAFVYLNVLDLWMVLVIVVRDFLITGLRGYADFHKVSFVTSKLAKWKTFIQMVFIYYLLVIYTLLHTQYFSEGNSKIFSDLLDPDLIFYSMLFITLLTFYTGAEYIYTNWRTIKRLIYFEN